MTKALRGPGNLPDGDYGPILGDIARVIDAARRSAARSVNCVMTAAYWLVGRRIVESEQQGERRAAYGEALLERLSADLGKRYGRGFGVVNLSQMKRFYLLWPPQNFQTASEELSAAAPTAKAAGILQTASEESDQPRKLQTLSAQSSPRAAATPTDLAGRFPLPWSAYVRLLSVKNENARRFYEAEALRGGWSVRQLDRQIEAQFYERTALSRNKAAMLAKGAKPLAQDQVSPEEAIKDPYVLEFLGLKDEYSESDLEEALIRRLEAFLLELGGDFCFVGRQKRLRIGDEWYRVDLVFFHRRLCCLVIVDLKLGRFTHADAGQMHLYLNYAAEHWVRDGENPPVGLILCAQKDEAVARYALDRLPNKVLAAEYRTALPNEKELAAEVERTRMAVEERRRLGSSSAHERKA
jgi:predicted nuclease of restriction endonuclease-like (RecB) superfamily